jgi:hypothetical protein
VHNLFSYAWISRVGASGVADTRERSGRRAAGTHSRLCDAVGLWVKGDMASVACSVVRSIYIVRASPLSARGCIPTRPRVCDSQPREDRATGSSTMDRYLPMAISRPDVSRGLSGCEMLQYVCCPSTVRRCSESCPVCSSTRLRRLSFGERAGVSSPLPTTPGLFAVPLAPSPAHWSKLAS